jgi:solute carrier family 25 ornithine transporter 2/15
MIFPAGPLRTMIAGAVGGIVFWIVIFPADVVKSRIQVSRLSGSLLSIMVQIFKEEGKNFKQRKRNQN